MQRALAYIQQFEATFVRLKYEQSFEERRKAIAETKRDIIKANRRISELDKLFLRIYEDNVAGKLTDERFQAMSSGYESEQSQLKADVSRMQEDVAKGEETSADFQAFLTSVRQYTDVSELTTTILNELIARIEVHAPEKENGKRTQQIDIYYNAVGVINIPSDEELAALLAERQEQVTQKHLGA